jgi:hypothetical protein
MLQSTMQKRPDTFTEKFHGFFTAQRLIMIISLLLGVLLVRVLGI